jgi:hypothetical protein
VQVCDEAVGVQQDSVSIKSLNEFQFFSSVYRLRVNCEESDCSLVILCASLCGAVHLLQQCEVGINSMSDLK